MSVTISQLPPGDALTGDELVPVVQDNATVRTTTLEIAQLAGGGGGGFANPTGVIGLAAVNGSQPTAMRSDAAPPLSQSISPTWLGAHTFTSTVALNGTTTVSGTSINSANLITSGTMATARLGSGSATANTLLHGNSTWSSVSLSADVSGNLPVANLNGGSGASSSTFWRGDATWSVLTVNGEDAGYLDLPQNPQDVGYQFVLDDRGKHVYAFGAGGITWVIPANLTVAFPIGTAIAAVNGSGGDVVLDPVPGVTLTLAGTGVVATATIAADGMATLLKVGTDAWFVSGAGVS